MAEPAANPLVSGCLRAKLGSEWRVRVCNSDDANNNSTSPQGHCSVPDFNYPEIRIAPGNWESSIFQAYITQIVLSEILGVPATLESGSTLQVFHTAPSPVETPHPNKQTFSRGASSTTFAHEISASTVYSDIVLHPIK